MKLLRVVPVFVSGFIVYGIVATAVGSASDAGPLEVLADPVANASAESGSRLKAQYLAGADGSKDYQFGNSNWVAPNTSYNHPTAIYYDTQRMEQCSFAVAADGAMRCLPLDFQQEGNGIYQDAACTQRMVAIQASQPGCNTPLPKYAAILDTATVCPVVVGYYPNHYYPIGQFLGPNLGTCYYKNSQNVCQYTNCPSGGSGYAFYALNAEVPASSFVLGTPTVDP